VKHGFNIQVITYVKDEGGNFSTMTKILISIISCEGLSLAQPFVGSCCGLVMYKCCYYAINDSKFFFGLTIVSIKETQSILQKIITCTKKSGKGQ